MLTPSIFKSYDIRGRAPEEIDAAGARRIAKAIANIERPSRVVVGRDMRATSDELEEALIDGFLTAGVSVARIGSCTTPMFNFSIGEAEGAYDLGVMITASHNPGEYNGFKMTRRDNLPIGQESGMEELRELACSDVALLDASERGSEAKDDALLERYVDAVLQKASLSDPLPSVSAAVDAGNGMEGIVLPKLRARLRGMSLQELFWDPDGSFPNHEANPLKTETLATLQQSVRRDGCAFGAAFDGDGDRVGFVDEKGDIIPGDMLTALFARELLREHGAGTVLFDLRSSWSVQEVIREQGGVPVMSRVGHAHIKRQMREMNALFAGELSMHFYFRDFWNCESGDYAMLLLLKLLMRERKPLSEIWRPLRRYAHSGEINFRAEDPRHVMEEIEERYGEAAADASRLDGVRMEFRPFAQPEEDWWFNLRPSNTEPLLRLNLEARTPEVMERRKAELSSLLTVGS